MRVLSAAVLVASLSAVSAFVAPVPAINTKLQRSTLGRARATETKMMLDGFDVPSTLLALAKENDVFVKNAGDYAWGTVEAPEWVLPVAAFSVLSAGILVPLFLRSGVDSFNSGGDAAVIRRSATSPKVPAAKAAPVKPTAAKPAPKVAPKPAPKAAPAKAAPAKAAAPAAPKPAFPWQKASSTPAAPAKVAAKPAAPKVAAKPAPKAAPKAAAPAAKPAAKKFIW